MIPPTGLPALSVTLASNVDRLEVPPEICATTLGVDWSVTRAAVAQAAVKKTERESLLVACRRGSESNA